MKEDRNRNREVKGEELERSALVAMDLNGAGHESPRLGNDMATRKEEEGS